jgi:hypothetical protein
VGLSGGLDVGIEGRSQGYGFVEKLAKKRVDLQRFIRGKEPDNGLRRDAVQPFDLRGFEIGDDSLRLAIAADLDNSHLAIVS